MNYSKLTPVMFAALALVGCGAGASIDGPFVLGTVTVSGDTPPTATAGPDQTVVEGDIVTVPRIWTKDCLRHPHGRN